MERGGVHGGVGWGTLCSYGRWVADVCRGGGGGVLPPRRAAATALLIRWLPVLHAPMDGCLIMASGLLM